MRNVERIGLTASEEKSFDGRTDGRRMPAYKLKTKKIIHGYTWEYDDRLSAHSPVSLKHENWRGGG